MKKGDAVALSNLLSSMKEGVKRLEEAIRKKDDEEISLAKKEILNLQIETAKLI